MKKVEFAKTLQCSPGAITALLKKGMPKEPDGTIDRDKCLRWIVRGTSGKNGGWGEGKRGASLRDRAEALLQAAHPKLGAGKEIPKATKRTGRTKQPSTNPAVWDAVADTLRRAAAPEEVLKFAGVCFRAGCTALQAFILGTWYSLQPALIDFENLDPEDLNSFEQPSDAQWLQLLGADFNIEEAEDELDRVTLPETLPPERI